MFNVLCFFLLMGLEYFVLILDPKFFFTIFKSSKTSGLFPSEISGDGEIDDFGYPLS